MRAWTVDADDIRVADGVKKEGGPEPDLWVRLYRLEF